MTPPRAAVPLLALTLLAVASSAQAALILTPLQLSSDRGAADVGDTLNITVAPTNASAQAAYQGQTLRVAWDTMAIGDTPERHGEILDDLVLGPRADATFAWTVPEAVRDANVLVVLWHGEDRVGQLHVRVGDAPPIAFSMGSGDGSALSPGDGEGQNVSAPPRASTPGFEGIAAAAGLGLVALVASRRRA